MLSIFEILYNEKGEALITDQYILAEGSYLLIDKNGEIKFNLEVDKNADKQDLKYEQFAKFDYYSRLIDMNKPIDSNKLIHSNNYLTFFVKKDVFTNKKFTEEVIDGYYSVLTDPRMKYKGNKTKGEMYEQAEEEYEKVDENFLEKNKRWIKENIFSILEKVNPGKNYLKIFFEADDEVYIAEGNKYLIPNIYNSTDYNMIIHDKTYGLPNDNMGLNAKKPFLENKNRKVTVPYMISTDEVLLQKKLFDYLMNFASDGKRNIYFGMFDDETKKLEIKPTDDENPPSESLCGWYVRLKKGKEVEIHDYDVINHYNPSLKLEIDNVVKFDVTQDKKNTLEYREYEKLKDIQRLVNEVFFNKMLTTNYFTDAKDIKIFDSVVKEEILLTRKGFFNWFFKGDIQVIRAAFPKAALKVIKNSIRNDHIISAKQQFNLYCALMNYFTKGEESMADIAANIAGGIREKINGSHTGKIESDQEYYFAVGQLVNYLLSFNKSSKATHSLINPILNCKKPEKLKGEALKMFKRYNHDDKMGGKRFNNLYAMVLGYVPDSNIVDEKMLLTGYLYSSLIYEKPKGEK